MLIFDVGFAGSVKHLHPWVGCYTCIYMYIYHSVVAPFFFVHGTPSAARAHSPMAHISALDALTDFAVCDAIGRLHAAVKLLAEVMEST
jgi:hypothetical protein